MFASSRFTNATLAAVGLVILVARRAAGLDAGGSSSSDLTQLKNGASSASTASADTVIFTGAATHSLPLQVPPGRLGVQPAVRLIYNSQHGANGMVGVGWDLGLEAIERSLKDGVNYAGNQFVFRSGGAGTELTGIGGTEPAVGCGRAFPGE